MKIKSILLALSLTSVALAEPITGAFGIKLGDKFNPPSGLDRNDGGRLWKGTYEVTPEAPYRAFSKYYVMITPKTHIIYGIYAESDPKGISQFQSQIEEKNLLMIVLKNKYTGTDGVVVHDGIVEAGIEQGSPIFRTIYTNFSMGRFTIKYTDVRLAMQNQKERDELTLEGSKINTSSL